MAKYDTVEKLPMFNGPPHSMRWPGKERAHGVRPSDGGNSRVTVGDQNGRRPADISMKEGISRPGNAHMIREYANVLADSLP